MKIKKDKNEEMKVISHQSIIQNWEKEFEAILKQKKEKNMELFPVDKEWFENYKNSVLSDNISIEQKLENYNRFLPFDNSNILHDKKSIKPDFNFIFLNKESMDSFSHYIMKKKKFNIKIIARFLNGKMVSKIGKGLYYVCYVDDKNDIKEGILMFGDLDILSINSLIYNFQRMDINIFLYNYFHEKPFSNEKFIIYHRNEFDLLIKNKDTNSFFKKNNLKKINMPKNIKSFSNGIYNSTKNIHHLSPNKKNMKDNNLYSNISFKPNGALNESNSSKGINKNYKLNSPNLYNNPKLRKFYLGENQINSRILSNLVDCIYEYYYNEEMLKQFINNRGQFKILQMINKNWLENFKDKIHYNKIKKLLKGKESGEFKKLIIDFINNNNLNNIQIDNIPKIKQEYINGKSFYYNDYQLLTKSCFSQFYKSFKNDYQKNKEFPASNLDNKNIFIKYGKNIGEIINYDNKNIVHIYIIESENHLDDILNSLQNYGLEDGLKKYGVDITTEFNDQKALKINKFERIGIIISLNNQNNNENIISSDEDIIKNDENVFDNNQRGKKSRNIYNKSEIFTPKIIKKRKVLHKSNLKNSENGKENKTYVSFKTPNIYNKSLSKFENNNENNNNNNPYYKTNTNNISNNKNLNKTMTNLKDWKKSNNNIILEPNNDSKKLNYSNSIYSKSPSSKTNKMANNNLYISKLDSNKTKISNNKLGVNQSITFKNTLESSKIPNEVMHTSPSLKFNKTKEIFPSKKKTRKIRPPSFPKETNKDTELLKQYDINPKLKNNNKKFLSPKESKKRYQIMPPEKKPDDEPPFQYDNNKNTPGLTGLQNIGATCYMNATLQCFSNVQRFREGILRLKGKNSLNKDLSYSLKEVLVNIWKNNKIKYYPPYNFKNLISQMNPLFEGVQANDSKDLILFILETIHRELNLKKNSFSAQSKVNNSDFMSVFNQFTKFYKSNNQSIVSDEFYGYFVSIMKCGYCNAVTYNVQIMNILIFPLEKVRICMKKPYNFVTLDDCFKNYEEPELLAGSDKIFCNFCKMTTNAHNQNKLIIAPKTLIINLNRGKGLEFKVGIKFEEYLDIKNYLLMSDKSPNYYELVGVISHFGESNMGGHFIAYCKNSFDGKWYKFNDAIVNESSFQEASFQGLPYVLFYSYIEN